MQNALLLLLSLFLPLLLCSYCHYAKLVAKSSVNERTRNQPTQLFPLR